MIKKKEISRCYFHIYYATNNFMLLVHVALVVFMLSNNITCYKA